MDRNAAVEGFVLRALRAWGRSRARQAGRAVTARLGRSRHAREGSAWTVSLVAGALVLVVLAGALARYERASTHGDEAGLDSIVLSYGSIAHNLAGGQGYYTSVSPAANAAMLERAAIPGHTLIPFHETLAGPPGKAYRPSPYLTPGFPYFASLVWRITGSPESYTSVQQVQGVVDGIAGPLALFVILAAAGMRRAGLLAALIYALSARLTNQSTLFLPDAWSAVIPVTAAAAFVLGVRLRRPVEGSVLAGLVIGTGGWFRGDHLALLPFLLLVAAVLTPYAWQRRTALVGAMVAGWAVPAIALGFFYQDTHGEFHLSRPGTGILLWEGIGQQPNPWGIGPPPGGNLDTAAGDLLRANGYEYGGWDGDAFLVDEAIGHMRDDPAWFIGPTLRRSARVALMKGPPGAEETTWWVRNPLPLGPAEAPLFAPVSALGLALTWRRSRLVAAVLLAVWASRVLPFSFLRDESRFAVAVVPVYAAGIAVALDFLLGNASRLLQEADSALGGARAAFATYAAEQQLAGGTAPAASNGQTPVPEGARPGDTTA